MSALAALLLVVPLAALHPYERGGSSDAARRAGSASHDSSVPSYTLTLPAGSDTALPESFKVDIRGSDEAPVRNRQSSAPSLPSQPSEPSLPSEPSRVVAPRSATSAVSPVSPASPTSAVSATSGKATTSPKSCNDRAVPGTTINAIHSDSHDDGTTSFKYMSLEENGNCSEATLVGAVTFTEAEDDVASMPVTAYAAFRERANGTDREVVIRSGEDGAIAHLFRLNGQSAPYDDSARRWLAGYLPAVLREGAFNVKPRIARLRAQRGVDGVLGMIETIRSSGSKRTHYEALLADGRLSADDLDKIVRHAGRNIPSSGDLRSVLTKAAPSIRGGVRAASAIEQAVMAVPSSGDRTAVLRAFAETSDRDLLLSVMRLAETIPSSGDKSSLLRSLAPSYLDRNDDALRGAFFRTLSTVPSSGDMRSVLTGSVMGYAAANEKVAFAVASAASAVPSSGDRASVLLGLADGRAIRSARVREAYLRATEGMGSGDATRVLRAVAVDRY